MKTERQKRAEAKRDAEREPVKIAERMVDVTNCKKAIESNCGEGKGKEGHRREVLRKNAIMYFNEDGFELEFNVKKPKEEYYEYIESINSFVEKMMEKMDILNVISLSHYVS